jgi:callose synthase
MNISSWFLVFSWMMAPFIFNPSGFDWLKTVYDFEAFITWLWYSKIARAEQSWETWWYEEQEHLKTTGLWGKLLEIIVDLRFFFFQYGIVYHLNITDNNTSIAVYLLSWIFMVAAVAIYITLIYASDKYAAKEHIYYRLVQLLVITVTLLVVILLLRFTALNLTDLFTSLMAFIPTGWGMIQIALVLRPFLQSTLVWDTVVSLARMYDMLFGLTVMAPLAFLSWMPGFQSMQTRILFNEAFSRGLQISRIVTGKNANFDM